MYKNERVDYCIFNCSLILLLLIQRIHHYSSTPSGNVLECSLSRIPKASVYILNLDHRLNTVIYKHVAGLSTLNPKYPSVSCFIIGLKS